MDLDKCQAVDDLELVGKTWAGEKFFNEPNDARTYVVDLCTRFRVHTKLKRGNGVSPYFFTAVVF